MSIWLQPGNGTWNLSGNWSGGVPNAVGAVADFTFTGSVGAALIDLPDSPAITVGTMNVTLTDQMGMIIRGPTTGTAELIFNNGANAAQVNIDSLANSSNGFFRMIAANLTVQLASNTIFNVINLDSKAQLAAPISGTGALIKTGAGILELNNGGNTFSGGIQIQGGILDALFDGALSTGGIQISNLGTFRSSGVVDQSFSTIFNAAGTQGSGSITASTGDILTLTGSLSHNGQGTFLFGSTADTGTIVANFSVIGHNPTLSSFRIVGGTLKIGSQFVANSLFSYLGIGLTEVSGNAILDTAGFSVSISNLDLDAGTIRSSSGALNVTVNDVFIAVNSQSGTFEGTVNADSLTINALFGFSLSAATFTNWTAGVDQIVLNGSANGNTLTGSAQAETINGFDGVDSINGNGGADFLNGGEGDDSIVVTGTGASVDGGGGTDTLFVQTGVATLNSITGIEVLNVSSGANLTLTGTQFATGLPSTTSLSGAGTVTINMTAGVIMFATPMAITIGSTLGFTINGTTDIDIIKANLNTACVVNAGDNVDQIRTSNLADTINAGAGNDKIMALGGADILTGGTGNDQFRYLFTTDSGTGANADQILDFISGSDKLDFRLLDADPFTAGRQALTFIGTLAFVNNGIAQVRYSDLGADLRVFVDLDGNGVSDMEILLVNAGAQTLLGTDFLL